MFGSSGGTLLLQRSTSRCDTEVWELSNPARDGVWLATSQVEDDVAEQSLRESATNLLRRFGCSNVTVQVGLCCGFPFHACHMTLPVDRLKSQRLPATMSRPSHTNPSR